METCKPFLFKAHARRPVVKPVVDWEKYTSAFLNQSIPKDDPCKHEKFSFVSKQTRCADEIQTNFITCRLCGKVQTS